MFEPKILYRAAVEEVPEDSFECEIGKADILRSGNDVTIIAWGTQIHVLLEVADMAKKDLNINCEVIDLVSILPWDKDALCRVMFMFFFRFLYKFHSIASRLQLFCFAHTSIVGAENWSSFNCT